MNWVRRGRREMLVKRAMKRGRYIEGNWLGDYTEYLTRVAAADYDRAYG